MTVVINWNEQNLRVLHDSAGKMTAAQIALLIPNATREAILGKMHRLKLKGVPQGRYLMGKKLESGTKIRPRVSSKVALARTSVAEQAMGAPRFKQVELTEPVIDLPNLWCEPVELLQLTEDTCRWPLDGGKYCGLRPWKANPYGASPYCVAHHRLGHRSVAEHTRLRPRT